MKADRIQLNVQN